MLPKVQQICFQGLVYDKQKNIEPVIQEFTEKIKLAKTLLLYTFSLLKTQSIRHEWRQRLYKEWSGAELTYCNGYILSHLLLDSTYQREWLHMVTLEYPLYFFVSPF